jgi:hypothetical protein
MSGLLHCPFCGGSSIDPEFWKANDGRFGPGCDDCSATADSTTAWNRRTPPTDAAAVAAEREALAELLQQHRCNSDGVMRVRQCVDTGRCRCSCGLYLARARSAALGGQKE